MNGIISALGTFFSLEAPWVQNGLAKQRYLYHSVGLVSSNIFQERESSYTLILDGAPPPRSYLNLFDWTCFFYWVIFVTVMLSNRLRAA